MSKVKATFEMEIDELASSKHTNKACSIIGLRIQRRTGTGEKVIAIATHHGNYRTGEVLSHLWGRSMCWPGQKWVSSKHLASCCVLFIYLLGNKYYQDETGFKDFKIIVYRTNVVPFIFGFDLKYFSLGTWWKPPAVKIWLMRGQIRRISSLICEMSYEK